MHISKHQGLTSNSIELTHWPQTQFYSLDKWYKKSAQYVRMQPPHCRSHTKVRINVIFLRHGSSVNCRKLSITKTRTWCHVWIILFRGTGRKNGTRFAQVCGQVSMKRTLWYSYPISAVSAVWPMSLLGLTPSSNSESSSCR